MPFAKGRLIVYPPISLMNRPCDLQTMLAHFQDEAHKLHELVQAQEKEVRYPAVTISDTGTYQTPGARASSVA